MKARSSLSPPAIVLEAVLALCHEGHRRIRVGEIATLASSILAGRGESMEISSRGAGEILRRELGFFAKRKAAGHELLMDTGTLRQVHRLASRFSVLSLLEPLAGCAFCEELLRDAQANSDANDVHDVHNVHGEGRK